MNKSLARALRSVRPAPLGAALKRMLRVEREVVQTSLGRFYADPASELGVALSEDCCEPWMCETIRRYLPKGGVFVDVGANEGVFSVMAAPVASGVLAIEPQDRLIPIIQENLRLNSAANVQVSHVAITDCPSHATLYLSPDTNTGSTALVRSTRYRGSTQTVRTATLESIFDQHGVERADLVKMDIEGFEHEAILGSKRLFLDKRIAAIVVDIHPHLLTRRGKEPNDITDFLHTAGYTMYDNVWFIQPPDPIVFPVRFHG